MRWNGERTVRLWFRARGRIYVHTSAQQQLYDCLFAHHAFSPLQRCTGACEAWISPAQWATSCQSGKRTLPRGREDKCRLIYEIESLVSVLNNKSGLFFHRYGVKIPSSWWHYLDFVMNWPRLEALTCWKDCRTGSRLCSQKTPFPSKVTDPRPKETGVEMERWSKIDWRHRRLPRHAATCARFGSLIIATPKNTNSYHMVRV